MRHLLRALLRLFPEDIDGILRSEMEETFLDGLRSSASPTRFAFRELWSLFKAGTGERVDGFKRIQSGEKGASFGPESPSPKGRRPVRRMSFFSLIRDDIRFALRKISKSFAFTAASVLTLTVGIGATVAMFSILQAALLRAQPFPEPDELVLGRATFSGDMNMTCSYPDYLSHKEGGDAFEVMAAVLPYAQGYTLTGKDVPQTVGTFWVTADFFEALDVTPAMGRTFLPEDGELSSPEVVVISHGLWQSWFGGNEQVLGETLTINGQQATVIGVMPADFRFMVDTDIWGPVRPGMFDTEGRRSHSWQVIGRLRNGVTLAQAQAQMDVISAQLAEEYPESHTNKGMGFVSLGEGLAENYRPGILLLMGATTLLLLIACGNVAGLLAARATVRRVELSVRAALGASRRVLVRQLLVESMIVAILAGVGGSILALWIQRAILTAIPLDMLGISELGLSGPMLSFALVVSLGTAILFGTGPALSASRAEPAEELRGGRTSTSGKSGSRVRSGLVVAQVALSVILLTGSGLLIRSFVELQNVDLGFPTEDIVTAQVAIGGPRYAEWGSGARFYQGLIDDIESMPGVESAAFVDKIPTWHRWTNWYIWDADKPEDEDGNRLSTFSRVSMPGYFETIGVPFLRGNDHPVDFMMREEPYLVINQATAEALFPDQDPIGRRITVFNGMENLNHEVLGVVADFRVQSVRQEPLPQMYFHHADAARMSMNLMVRSRGDSGPLVASIRQAVLDRDPDIPLQNVASLDELLSNNLSTTRLLSIATGLFAVTALLLSLTGLYAVLAFYVGQRTREIGIRVAFGATSGRVSGMVMKRGLAMVGGGLVLGLVGTGASARILQSQLYQVGTFDPLTLGSVAGGFVLVGVLAAMVPARKATKVDPVRAMQVE